MKKSLFAIAAAAAVLAGCQQEDFVKVSSKAGNGVLKATIVNESTRTTLTEDGSVYHVNWVAGDKIAVIDETESLGIFYCDEVQTPYSVFYLTEGDSVAFQDGLKAYYPTYLTEGVLASLQTYVENGLKENPMYAEAMVRPGDDVNLDFKNLCGAIKLNVTSTVADAKVAYITLTADQGMAGEFTVAESAAVITPADEPLGVKLFCSEGVAVGSTAVPFFISVPANTYTGLEIKVIMTDGKTKSYKLKAGNSLKVERAKVQEANLAITALDESEVTMGGTAVLPEGPDFNMAVKCYWDETASAATPDLNVKKIIFNTNCPLTEGEDIADISSDAPVYMVADASGIVLINTPAEELRLGSNGSNLFSNFGALEEIENLNLLNTEDCEDMSFMFSMIEAQEFTTPTLKSLDLSKFNTENCTTMRSMFNGCESIESFDLTSFNTENVETMEKMFNYCNALTELDVHTFDTKNVTSLKSTFEHCEHITSINVSGWDTQNVNNFNHVFGYCRVLPFVDISSWDTSNGGDIAGMFYICNHMTKVDVSNVSFESATDVRSFFYNAFDIQTFDMSHIKGCERFKSYDKFNYFFYHTKGAKEFIFGDLFYAPNENVKSMSSLFARKTDGYEYRPGNQYGELYIYASQECADWWATTSLAFTNNGTDDGTIPAIPVHFVHYQTGAPINVTWAQNADL